jgi:hypothetical protein
MQNLFTSAGDSLVFHVFRPAASGISSGAGSTRADQPNYLQSQMVEGIVKSLLAILLVAIAGASVFESTVKAQEDPCGERATFEADNAINELRDAVKRCLAEAKTLEDAKDCSEVEL